MACSRKLYVDMLTVTLVLALNVGRVVSEGVAFAQSGQQPPIPQFQVDPFWPKELPNNWLVGNVVGVALDSKDNIWIIHRPRSQAGADKTPPVIAFDPAGNVIQSWGGRDTVPEWGTQEHGLYIDYQDNVWLGFGGGLPYDLKSKATTDNAHILKFTPNGKLLLAIGTFGMGTEGSNSTKYLANPTDVFVDRQTNEAFISDGYLNRRIIVVDANDGAYKRHWGAYGKKPDDGPVPGFDPKGPPRQQFQTVHCVAGANDGLIYACDSGNQRIQVFRKDGSFVKSSDGQVGGGDIAFSRDPQQRLMFVVNNGQNRVHVVLRDSLEVLATFGRRGRWAGQFESPHSLAMDSKGNLFVAETLDGRRVQKFVPKRP